MKSYVAHLIGGIWQPGFGLCGTSRSFQAPDDETAVLAAHSKEAGDFEYVTDFEVLRWEPCSGCGQPKRILVKPWRDENSAFLFDEGMYGDE